MGGLNINKNTFLTHKNIALGGAIIFLFLVFSTLARGELFLLDEPRTLTTSTDQNYAYMNSNRFFTVYYGDNPSTGDVVKFIKDGVEMTLLPMALNYNNDLSQLEQISMPQGVQGNRNGNQNQNMQFQNAYGTGIDLIYETQADKVKEKLIINSLSNLPAPAQYVIDGGNVQLELGFQLASNGRIFIDGVEWDQSSEVSTTNDVLVKNLAGNELYRLPRPFATDSNSDIQYGYYVFKKSANKLYVRTHIPFDWINNTAVFPIHIDPTFIVDYSPIPGQHLINGTNAITSDSDYDTMIDITAGVSDNSTATNYLVRKQIGNTANGIGQVTMNFKFDETSGTVAVDSSSVQNDGTYFGSPNLTAIGVKNTAINFDGIDDYVVIYNNRSEYSLNSTEELVVCFAINTEGDVPNNDYIFDMKDGGLTGWEIRGADDEIRFSTDRDASGNKNHETVFKFNDNQWHTYCGFSGLSKMESYVDGSFDKTTSTTQIGSMITTENYRIGANTDSSDFTEEMIDELCVIKGYDLNISSIAYQYNLTQECTGLFSDETKGIAITGKWDETYLPQYDWFLRVYKTTIGTDTLSVYAYNDTNNISSQYVTKTVDSTGWFNINVSSLMDYELNTLGLNFTMIRFWTENNHNFSEVRLRQEINDTELPSIFNCQANNTNITCAETFEVSCNATDNLDVDEVRFQIDSTNYTGSQYLTHYHYIYDPIDFNGSTTFVWQKTHAKDILNQWNSTDNNVNINYSCNVPGWINITHIGNTTIDQYNLTFSSIVIYWNTTNPSDSRVNYGLSQDNKNLTVFNPDLVIDHYMTLTDLIADTVYYYDIISSFNPNQTLYNFTFTTPPLTANITVTVGNTNATIDSTTNLNTNSTIEYDENMTYLFIDIDTVYDLNHSQFLSGLMENTTYFVNQTFCRSTPSSPRCFSFLYNFTTLAGCIENWVEDTIVCLINDTYLSTFNDTNACGTVISLPAQNGTSQYCNYCSEDLVQVLGPCQSNSSQSVHYTDNNYWFCCSVTDLPTDCSVDDLYPYNETTSQNCTYFNNTMGDIVCQNEPDFSIREKEYCLAYLPIQFLNETFKCISNIKNANTLEIMQTNPEYREGSSSFINFFKQDPETREYFTPASAIVNFYYTQKNLLPETDYILSIECSSQQRMLSSSKSFQMGYEGFEFVFFRGRWLIENAGYIIAGIIIIFILLALAWLVYRGSIG